MPSSMLLMAPFASRCARSLRGAPGRGASTPSPAAPRPAPRPPPPPLAPVSTTGEAEIIVVVGFGRTPQKVPVRVPIGLALTMCAGAMSPANAAQANALAAKGLVTWVNYPALRRGRGGYSIPSFFVDGRGQSMEEAIDIEGEVVEAWHKKEETIVLSAITRMIARLVAGEVVQ